ncbi:molybdopterin biosynthesis protein [Thermosediminibacter oceani]|uniref:Molybdopterin molybdenumtransferase n=1 Tax=Thermosediminibacter oceani (strain ATCC BAA-1034 / DSM 16646 / JW/IW-1228P) TaxID=555079 RepID=D9S0C8_THEOJ|nr:molybdopterin biosynthesis protein [Thermosediminibacter oceani]ADL07056.1 molybdopterin molybdochelatase [Thermosediminibacter oceani DSM 16646]
MKEREVYLENVSLAEAVDRFFVDLEESGALRLTGAEVVSVRQALGRITAEPVFARISSPHYSAAAMDGIAVSAKDTFGAGEKNPVRLKEGVNFHYVDTGDPLPPGCDAVIMIEEVHPLGDGEVEIVAPCSPWDNVRGIGEDIAAAELVVPENHRLRPQDLSAILAAGHTAVRVRKKPRVAVIPTGTELVNPGEPLKPGDIIESNSAMISGLVEEWGGEALVLEKAEDDFELIKRRIEEGLSAADVVVINAGSSAGSEDYTAKCIRAMGELLVHGVAIKPGKPVVLGRIAGKPVIGIPGYPVSAYLAMELFVKPIVYRMQGLPVPGRHKIRARLSRRVVSSIGTLEFLRVKVGRMGSEFIASPLSRGAGVIMSVVRADGIVRIPESREGIESGESVEVELLRDREEIENTVLMIGSHDVTIDLLANELKRLYPEITLSSAHVGSMGGIMALMRGETHMAGLHLLDPETGEYNLPYIRKYLAGRKVVLVNLAYRQQGLMVAKGNPKGIRGIEDLVREDVTFVNRQKGAGTRILLDLKLKELDIDPGRIRGYGKEEYTHLAVAAAVAGGMADAGLGILAAARAMDLDFVPVAPERFDIAIPHEFYPMDSIQKVLKILRSEEFKRKIESLGGYDTSRTGELIGGD